MGVVNNMAVSWKLAAVVAIICAAVLAFNGISGWGWFLVLGFMCAAGD